MRNDRKLFKDTRTICHLIPTGMRNVCLPKRFYINFQDVCQINGLKIVKQHCKLAFAEPFFSYYLLKHSVIAFVKHLNNCSDNCIYVNKQTSIHH